jgi:hypothetical protein
LLSASSPGEIFITSKIVVWSYFSSVFKQSKIQESGKKNFAKVALD